MKAKVIAREPIFKKFFDAKEKLAEDIRAVVSGNDFLFRGIFWGIAVAALIVGVINLQKINHLSKVSAGEAIDSFLQAELEGIKDSEFYLKLQSSLNKDLQPAAKKFINEYLKSKKYSEFFDETTKKAFAEEIEQMLMAEITSTNTLTKEQESEVSKLISEQIALIDYSQIEAQIQDAISKMESHTNSSVETMEQKVLEIVGVRAEKNIADIVNDINTTNQELKTIISDLQTRIAEENRIRDEYNRAKFEAVAEQMDLNYETTNNKINENYETTNNKINENYETTNNKIDENYESTNNKIDENYETTNNKIDGNYEMTNSKIDANYESTNTKIDQNYNTTINQMQANYEELMNLIKTTNGRISDPRNNEYFQYGYDAGSGSAGYYLNGQFKPF